MNWLLQVIAAYVVADAMSGLYHFATDRGLNIKSQIEMFQEHHKSNSMDGFDWQTFAAGMPIAVVGAWFHSSFAVALGFFVALTQVTHYYAHRRSSSLVVHRIVSLLQSCGVIVHPASHHRHHGGDFDRDFCLLSGLNNWWLNMIISAFRKKAVS